MESIKISLFKATCLSLLEKIFNSGEPVTITKNGKPLVVVYPANQKFSKPKFGCAKGSAILHADMVNFDTSKDWEALK